MPDFRSCFFDCHGDPFFIVNLERAVVDCNPAFEKMLGRGREEIIGKKCKEVFAGLPEHNCPVSQMLADKSVRRTFPLQLNSRRFQIIVDRIVNESGELLGFGHTVVDITKHYNDKIRDHLTGLFNRRYMEETLHVEWHRAERKNYPLGIMMLDLDHFKDFNDTRGHPAGDKLLKKLGELLPKQVRAGDVVCRYGGEEFTVIMPEASEEVMLSRAEKILKAVREKLVITISIGVALYPVHGDLVEEVIYAADAALYRAKEEGRNRVVVAQ
jgi:diguanylate cyclase (GGDEF)-like protein/PAS domain S-box-containing protein